MPDYLLNKTLCGNSIHLCSCNNKPQTGLVSSISKCKQNVKNTNMLFKMANFIQFKGMPFLLGLNPLALVLKFFLYNVK